MGGKEGNGEKIYSSIETKINKLNLPVESIAVSLTRAVEAYVLHYMGISLV